MKKLAFNNKKYLKIQREEINKRIKMFDGKLYLEFGGKLFDDYHASRVLPGFEPDSKLQMLLGLKAVPKPDDTADALALAVCHGHSAGSQLGRLNLNLR